MSDREKKLARVRKLLALSRNNPSRGEAEAAAAQAQRILSSLGLEALDEDAPLPDEYPSRLVATYPQLWEIELWTGAGELNACRCFLRKRKTEVILVGGEDAITATVTVVAGIRANAEQLCQRDVGRTDSHAAGQYLMGFVISCLDVMQRAAAGVEQRAPTTALAKRQTSLDELSRWCERYYRIEDHHAPVVIRTDAYLLGKRRGRS